MGQESLTLSPNKCQRWVSFKHYSYCTSAVFDHIKTNKFHKKVIFCSVGDPGLSRRGGTNQQGGDCQPIILANVSKKPHQNDKIKPRGSAPPLLDPPMLFKKFDKKKFSNTHFALKRLLHNVTSFDAIFFFHKTKFIEQLIQIYYFSK